MPFNTPLNSGQLDAHRGTASVPQSYFAQTLISVCENRVIYSARVNAPDGLHPAVELPIDGGSGTLADIWVGMTVLIAHVNDKRQAYFRGRVRKAWTSSLAIINESGAGFSDDDYVWVLNDFDVHLVLADYDGTEVLIDVDLPVNGVPPVVPDLLPVYVGDCDPDSGVYTQTLIGSALPGESGASISSYLWTLPAGATIISGSTTTPDITVEFDPLNDWVHLEVTDDGGRVLTRHAHIWAHDATNPPAVIPAENLSISCEVPIGVSDGASQGYSGSLDVFAGLPTMLERTLVCIWVRETYCGTRGSQVSNILLVGRTRDETNDTTFGQSGPDGVATITIEGPLAILTSVIAPSIEMAYGTGASSITAVIKNLTVWRAIWYLLSRFSTFGSVWPVGFDDMTDTFLAAILVTRGENLLTSVGGLAMSVNAVLQMAPDGRIELARRAVMLDDTGRNARPVIVDLGHGDLIDKIGHSNDYRPSTATVNADGGSFNGVFVKTVPQVTAWLANAPAGAPQDAPDNATLSEQALTAGQTAAQEQAEIATRAGNALAASQPPVTLPVTLVDGYHWLPPSVSQWVTWTLDGSETVGGRVYDTSTRWLVQAIQVTPDPLTGQVRTEATFVRETRGDTSEARIPPVVDTGKYGKDTTPPLELPPIDTSLTDFDFTGSDGNWVIGPGGGVYTPGTGFQGDCNADDDNVVDISKEFGTTRTVKRVFVTYTATATDTDGNRNLIQVRSDGTAAWFTVKNWKTLIGGGNVAVAEVPGLTVSQARVVAYLADCDETVTITDIEVEAVGGETWSHTWDPDTIAAWTADVQSSITFGHYSAGVGWVSDYEDWTGDDHVALNIYLDIGVSTHFVRMEMAYSITLPGTADNFPAAAIYAGTNRSDIVLLAGSSTDGPALVLSVDLSADYSYLYFNTQAAFRHPHLGTDPGGETTISSITVWGTGPNPFE